VLNHNQWITLPRPDHVVKSHKETGSPLFQNLEEPFRTVSPWGDARLLWKNRHSEGAAVAVDNQRIGELGDVPEPRRKDG
jgi:hypothetical protein